ncbi:carboxypeptidase-like regulatory domain-containing protein [Snuella lapsa]|uniref:TonB-dependent receptor n=1 Tax=Snuella lapsa TaxID=870481 RepID=A0ABP6Y3K1_9FLAO
MKRLALLSFLLFTAFCFGQNTGMIVGKIMDQELNNAPLVLANVSVKGTDIKLNTDITGLFLIENLKDGDYTLVCSFLGYETKEVKVSVQSEKPAEVKLSLGASSISLDDLEAITSIAQKEDKTSTN